MLKFLNSANRTSFHEKSAWIMATVILLAYGWYFWTAFSLYNAGIDVIAPYVFLMVAAVIGLVVAAIISFLAVTIASPNRKSKDFDKADERDKLYKLRGEARSAWILGAAVILGIGLILTAASPVIVANVLLAGLVIAELARLVLIIFYYRRGY